MSLMELRLFAAKPAEEAEAQSTTPRMTLARRLAEAISAYAEAAAMARSTPFELHLTSPRRQRAAAPQIQRMKPTSEGKDRPMTTHRQQSTASHLEGANDPFAWLEKCRSCIANWLAGRARKAQARRLAELVSRMDPHLRDDIGLPRDLEIPRGSNSTIAIATLIEVMSERRR